MELWALAAPYIRAFLYFPYQMHIKIPYARQKWNPIIIALTLIITIYHCKMHSPIFSHSLNLIVYGEDFFLHWKFSHAWRMKTFSIFNWNPYTYIHIYMRRMSTFLHLLITSLCNTRWFCHHLLRNRDVILYNINALKYVVLPLPCALPPCKWSRLTFSYEFYSREKGYSLSLKWLGLFSEEKWICKGKSQE